MPTYTFTGRNEQTGVVITGTREAISHAALGQDLLQEGILLTSFEEQRKAGQAKAVLGFSLARVPILERVLFTRYFALMLRAGLDVKTSLSTLANQTKNKTLASSIEGVRQGIERGKTLAESMLPFPKAFPSLFVSFVKVGETTGKLEETLAVLSQQLQKDFELRRAVRGGMLYPIVIISALLAVGAAMMIFVVPKLVEIFEGFNVELPLMTRILINISRFSSTYWYVVILGAIALVATCIWMIKVPKIRAALLHGLLFSPIIGQIAKNINIARFSRNLSSLLESGVAFAEALQILGENTPHPTYADVFIKAQTHVKQGKTLSGFFAEYSKLFPPLVVNIMGVGEQTGELDSVLKEVASFYEGEVDQTMKNLTSIMEPVLMILIGLGVGALAVSIISPIYSLVNVI